MGSPGVEVRSRRCTERTSFGRISGNCSKKAGKRRGRSGRCSKKIPEDALAGHQLQFGSKFPEVSSEVAEVDEVEQAEHEEHIELEQDEGEVATPAQDMLDHVEPLPSLGSKMAQNWRDIEVAKAKEQSSANFR